MSRVGIANDTIVAIGDGTWTSADGLRWARQADPEFQPDAWRHAMVPSDDRLTDFSANWKDDRSPGVDMWQTDGSTWTRVSRLPGSKDVRVNYAAYGAGRWFVLGSRDTETESFPIAWTSRDGVRWDRASYPVSLDEGGVTSLIGHEGGFIALGRSGGPGGACGTDSPYRTSTWTSPDGLVWHESSPIEGTGIYDMVVNEGLIVGIGQTLALKKVVLTAPLLSSPPSGSRSSPALPTVVGRLASARAVAGCGP